MSGSRLPHLRPAVALRGLALIATLVLVGYALEHAGARSVLDTNWIDAEVRGHGLSGEFLFLAVGALATAVGVPRQLIGFLGGYAFGLVVGLALAVVAAVLGCALSFYYARWLGRDMVRDHFGERVRRIDAFLRDNTTSMTVLIRLLPVGNNLVTNLAAGVSGVRATHFIAGSALGYVPQTLVFALLGSGIGLEPWLRIGGSVALFLVSGLMGVWLYRRYRHGRVLDAETERALADDDAAGPT